MTDETEPTVELTETAFPEPRGGVSAGIPYPSPTDPLMEGAGAIQAIATFLGTHGYGINTLSPSDANLNNLRQTGLYSVPSAVNGPTGAGWLMVLVVSFNNDYVCQRAYDATDGNWDGFLWERRMYNTAWGPWMMTGRRTLAGVVEANGAIYSGSGFSVTRWSPGHYSIYYGTPFKGNYPPVLVTPMGTRGNAVSCVAANGTDTNVEVFTFETASNGDVDYRFSFLVVQAPAAGPQ